MERERKIAATIATALQGGHAGRASLPVQPETEPYDPVDKHNPWTYVRTTTEPIKKKNKEEV